MRPRPARSHCVGSHILARLYESGPKAPTPPSAPGGGRWDGVRTLEKQVPPYTIPYVSNRSHLAGKAPSPYNMERF